MYSGYLYPIYRPFGYSLAYPYPYPYWVYGGYSGYGYGYGGGNYVGSAVANQSIINTGGMAGVSQIATPTVIW